MAYVQRGVAQVGNNVKNSAASGNVVGAYDAQRIIDGLEDCVACEMYTGASFCSCLICERFLKNRNARLIECFSVAEWWRVLINF
jgi:hypothetical protein